MSSQVELSRFAYASGSVLLLAEIYHSVVDREWMGYQFLQNFIFAEVLSTIVGFALNDDIIHGDAGTALLAIQFSLVIILTVLHLVKLRICYKSMRGHGDSHANSGISSDINKSESKKTAKPIGSIFSTGKSKGKYTTRRLIN